MGNGMGQPHIQVLMEKLVKNNGIWVEKLKCKKLKLSITKRTNLPPNLYLIVDVPVKHLIICICWTNYKIKEINQIEDHVKLIYNICVLNEM